MKQTTFVFGALVTLFSALIAGPALGANKPTLVVLDIELTGDTGGTQLAQEHAIRLKMESDKLREKLQQSGLYTVVDTAPAQPLITALSSQQKYLHDCNGCDLEIGRQLKADQVVVTWVDRVSGLILSLTYEFHDVATGQIVGRKSYDFRGDNDSAWTHAVKYMVEDLKETSANHAQSIRCIDSCHARVREAGVPARGLPSMRALSVRPYCGQLSALNADMPRGVGGL